jgi:hypothetical protein
MLCSAGLHITQPMIGNKVTILKLLSDLLDCGPNDKKADLFRLRPIADFAEAW